MKCKFCKNEATHKILYLQKKLFTNECEDVSIYVCNKCYEKINSKINNKVENIF